MAVICLVSICMINMPIFKYLGTTPISLINQNSMMWLKTVLVIGEKGVNIIRIMFGVLVLLQGIALITLIRKECNGAVFWNFIAGFYEAVIALVIMFYCLQLYSDLNAFIGIEVFEEKAGDGIYAMILLGVIQMAVVFVHTREKDKDVFDILSGK